MTLRKRLMLIISITFFLLMIIHYIVFNIFIVSSMIEPNFRRDLILTIFLIGLIYYLIMLVSIDRVVLAKLTRLIGSIKKVAESGDITEFLEVSDSEDELSYLGYNINIMLEKLDYSRYLIVQREARIRLITDNMSDMICQIDMEGVLEYVSPSHKIQLDYEPMDMVGKKIVDFVHSDDRDRIKAILQEAITTLSPQRCEYKCRHAGGHYISVETISKLIFNEQGDPVGMILSSRDITERKQMEEQLKYMSLHDSLTGLFNRTYFEQEMQRLSKSRYEHVGLIICDVDNLKFYNDSLGHSTGDKVLKTAADIIKRSFREGDVVARIGGDEFAVLLPGSCHKMVESACQRIRETMAEYNSTKTQLPLSMSMGFAVCNPLHTDRLFKEADNYMYSEKLHNSQDIRSATVQIMMKSLITRGLIDEGHADRLQSLAASLAEAVGLPENRVANLRLLAQFHDIGKVGTPDRILLKKGRLTEEEAAEMRQHCEIGYRIALSTPDLVPIADWILKQHEWWNGQGYPKGLAGTDIPLECRILSIADAYEAMASIRTYSEAMSQETALEEIKSYSGSQFDPELVEKFLQLSQEGHLE
ncbi:MAG: diguanylate cyclase [Dethiobacter sp.]|jgi:diguanylate cyclase (GGDEF)-like protein/PAS domain S-box-containing protein|nr:diguanylate cyclase [Dethiobacter sp.]